MVEAIEELFIPVLVFNNKPEDEAVLKSFEEPSWNNPVIRILKSDGSDLIARQDKVWETSAVAKRICQALQAAGQRTPQWLKSLDAPSAESTMTATFAMHCYWVGEAQLGALDGVLTTRAGWVGEKEVVNLVYDPATIEYETLLESALNMECASTVYTLDDEQKRIALAIVDEKTVEALTDLVRIRLAKSSDQKYSLDNSNLRFLPLTETQAVKVNAILASSNQHGLANWLSPRQQDLLKRIDLAISRNPDSLKKLIRPAADYGLDQYGAALESALTER